MSDIDWSTINLTALIKRPLWEPYKNTYAADQMGQGCYMDPPGYPSYFLRSVYHNGNSPGRGAVTIIRGPEGEGDRVILTADEDHDKIAPRLRKLWAPLPLDHERTRLWVLSVYMHLKHCYRDDDGIVAGKGENGMIVWPVPSYKLRHFVDDKRFSEEWRTAERTAVEAYNTDIRERAALVATPANHSAVRRIREFYPEHTLDLALIANPPTSHAGQWWETTATQPSIADCHSRNGIGVKDHATQWCQWCGRDPFSIGEQGL